MWILPEDFSSFLWQNSMLALVKNTLYKPSTKRYNRASKKIEYDFFQPEQITVKWITCTFQPQHIEDLHLYVHMSKSLPEQETPGPEEQNQ
jgi:hypothetical protein